MTHALKTTQPHFDNVKAGKKPFELRKNDRNFKEGDEIILQEYDPESKKYSGQEVKGVITLVMTDERFMRKDMAVLGIKLYEPTKEEGVSNV
jgi:ASC-1-like (ASCH) protein